MGVSREISDIALNHTLMGMEGVYGMRPQHPPSQEISSLYHPELTEHVPVQPC